MANINDYKVVCKKSQKYFELLSKELTLNNLPPSKQTERLGFYLFILDHLTTKNDILDLADLVTDTDFNGLIFNDKNDDFGVDAIFIDEDENIIQLFNFKYRESFKSASQQVNDTILSTKFINALLNADTSKLSGKIKNLAQKIIDNLESNDIWKLQLYVISNEEFKITEKDQNLIQLEKFYELEIISIGLTQIGEYISLRPEPIDAELILDNDAVMSFTESSISSSKSYILRLPLTEIIRITCNNKDLRNKYNIEDLSDLSNSKIDFSVLFDNVRGLVLKSKFNKNIYDSLKNETSKFFMYNNGLTLTANDIRAESVNAGKKVRISLKSIQVLNGGQTLRTIHAFNAEDSKNIEEYLSNGEILIRVFKTSLDQTLNNKIAEYTNSQNSISNIDLKSLRSEQLQLEQFLDDHNIIYSRKSGDTGISENKNYDYKISMERFGQVLFSVMGFPEKATNQKKNIFDKYYDDVFGGDSLEIEKSPDLIKKYFEIKKEYENKKNIYTFSEQKAFYTLYLDTKLDNNLSELIELLEKLIIEYEPSTGKEISNARKLIQVKFKEFIDEKIQSTPLPQTSRLWD